MIPPGYTPQADGTVIGPRGRVRKAHPRGRPVRGGPAAYLDILISIDGKYRHFPVHQLVCEAFHGPKPFPGAQVRHRDGNSLNNAASNLTWGTSAENHADKRDHGTLPVGERHGRAKLTEQQVREIRERYAAGGVSQRELAAEYGVGRLAVSRVVRRTVWTHI